MCLKFYHYPFSPQSRAVYIFLKMNHVQFEKKIVDLGKGEQFHAEFVKINPLKKVPVIEHNGFHLRESLAILRYLCREFNIKEHWYPKNSQIRARIDERLDWLQFNVKLHLGTYYVAKYLIPKKTGKPANPKTINQLEKRTIECVDHFVNVWLKDGTFLVGNQITIADLMAACDFEQTRVAGYDAREQSFRIAAWMERVSRATSPHYQKARVFLNKVVDKAEKDMRDWDLVSERAASFRCGSE